MPFKSEKQRRYLWANEPEIARDWSDKYGGRIDKNSGGIARLAFYNGGTPLGFIPGWDEHALASQQMKISGEPDYHAKAGFNFRENFPNVPLGVADWLANTYQTGSEGWRALSTGGDWNKAMTRADEEARLNKVGLRRQGFDINEYQNFMNNFNLVNQKPEKGTIVPDQRVQKTSILPFSLPPMLMKWMKAKVQSEGIGLIADRARAKNLAKKKAAMRQQVADAERQRLQAKVTAQANRGAAERVARGEGRDYGHTETRSSSGWSSSPFRKGGLATLWPR